MLALVVYSLKPVKLLGPCKRTQHCWPKTPNNTQKCCDLLSPFARAFTFAYNTVTFRVPQQHFIQIPQGNLTVLGMKMLNFSPMGVHEKSNSPVIAQKRL